MPARLGITVAHMDSTSYAAAVAANVERAILGAGLTVPGVARVTGIPRTTFARRLASDGFSPFSVAEVKAIANAVGTTAAALTTVYTEPVAAVA
ncbi:hypothetical protein EV386_1963 [Xylanimonas ulmi]|uniref:Cro/C1-type helix-turn-helix DNA-binding protein n=2 Tax=Xylanimonas ulmi TaxID=228973 RepID=A0A4Q7M3T8_9MICO|nr:hypothetical protein EV386_1963 [Xylanibacterium ulmi]